MGMILAFLLFSLLLNSLLKEPFLIWENHQKMRKMNQKVERWMEEPSTDLQSKVEQLGFDEGVKIPQHPCYETLKMWDRGVGRGVG